MEWKKYFSALLYVIMTCQGQPFNMKWSDCPTMQDSKVISVLTKLKNFKGDNCKVTLNPFDMKDWMVLKVKVRQR